MFFTRFCLGFDQTRPDQTRPDELLSNHLLKVLSILSINFKECKTGINELMLMGWFKLKVNILGVFSVFLSATSILDLVITVIEKIDRNSQAVIACDEK